MRPGLDRAGALFAVSTANGRAGMVGGRRHDGGPGRARGVRPAARCSFAMQKMIEVTQAGDVIDPLQAKSVFLDLTTIIARPGPGSEDDHDDADPAPRNRFRALPRRQPDDAELGVHLPRHVDHPDADEQLEDATVPDCDDPLKIPVRQRFSVQPPGAAGSRAKSTLCASQVAG